MPSLPVSSDITGASTTEGQAKSWLTNLRDWANGLFGSDGTQATALGALGAPLSSNVVKSGAYTVVAADRGRVIRCTGTWTLSLSAVATLGSNFTFAILNEGSGTITIDPNLTETIDGATTKAVPAGEMGIVYCDGSAFSTIGIGGAGAGLDADLLDGQHGQYYLDASVPRDCGHNNLGSFVFGSINTTGTYAAGALVGGSAVRPACIIDGGIYYVGVCSGTYRVLGYGHGAGGNPTTLLQRAA